MWSCGWTRGIRSLHQIKKEKIVSPEEIKSVTLNYIVIAVKNEDVMKKIRTEIFNLQGNCDNVVWRYPDINETLN